MEKAYYILKKLSGMNKITPESDLQNDLALDSISMVTLLLELEDAFDIRLDESDMNPFELKNVQEVLNLVEKYCGDKNEKNC